MPVGSAGEAGGLGEGWKELGLAGSHHQPWEQPWPASETSMLGRPQRLGLRLTLGHNVHASWGWLETGAAMGCRAPSLLDQTPES